MEHLEQINKVFNLSSLKYINNINDYLLVQKNWIETQILREIHKNFLNASKEKSSTTIQGKKVIVSDLIKEDDEILIVHPKKYNKMLSYNEIYHEGQ